MAAAGKGGVGVGAVMCGMLLACAGAWARILQPQRGAPITLFNHHADQVHAKRDSKGKGQQIKACNARVDVMCLFRSEMGVSGRVCRHCKLDEGLRTWEARLFQLSTKALAAGTQVTVMLTKTA